MMAMDRGGVLFIEYSIHTQEECTGSEVSNVSESDVVDVRLSYMGCTGWV